MTPTRADELKSELMQNAMKIAEAEQNIEKRLTAIELVRGHLDSLHRRRIQLEAQLERENAVLIRPEGKCVTLESNGVEWKV